MNEEIYAPPVSDPEAEIPIDGLELASRWARLGASILDGIIISVVSLPVMFVTGGFKGMSDPTHETSFLYNIGIALLGLLVFVLINAKFLKESGQTVGKKVLKIRAVTLDSQLAPVKWNLMKRYAFYLLLGQIPVIGGIIGIVNILFIFGKEKRCLHDLVGETKVVKC